MASALGIRRSAAVVDAVAVMASAQAGDKGLTKIWKMFKNLKAEALALHGELVAVKMAHASALLNNVRLQRDMKKVV